MACGKPVVATNVGENTEIVEHKRTGILVPPAEVSPLAEALALLLGNDILREEFGSAGRKGFWRDSTQSCGNRSSQKLYNSML